MRSRVPGKLVGVFLCFVLSLLLARKAAQFLVIDQPQKSNVILVLAGDTQVRPARALQLLAQGFAPRVILDVPANAHIYKWTQLELADEYVRGLSVPKDAVSLCAILGLSTKEEARDVAKCLASSNPHSVLLVTSEFHTRRALSIFRHEIPQRTFSVAAAWDDTEFGAKWWRRREWAKVNFDEWLRLIWWAVVDRWD